MKITLSICLKRNHYYKYNNKFLHNLSYKFKEIRRNLKTLQRTLQCFKSCFIHLYLNTYFYFILKALFVLKIFTFSCLFFGDAEKRLDKKAKVNFKIYDVTDWTTNDYDTHTAQYLKK